MKEMSFMSKRKRVKFNAIVNLEQIESVVYVTGTLLSKLRLLSGSYSECSSRKEIKNHSVKWDHSFSFVCKMTINPSTGLLDPCPCRLSVRKELKGGRSYQKLGYADINLAEYASPGLQTRRYLLEGYSDKTRQDNSLLQLSISLTRVSGELLYKVPTPSNQDLQDTVMPPGIDPDPNLHLPASARRTSGSLEGIEISDDCPDGDTDDVTGRGGQSSVASSSSGFSSLTRKNQLTGLENEPGHSRSPSNTSNLSKAINGLGPAAYDRGYGSYDKSKSHVRNPSSDLQSNHIRHSSLGSARDTNKLLLRQSQRTMESERLDRIDKTRVDADDLVNQLVDNIKLNDSSSAESGGLQLFIAKDGTAAVGRPGELSKDYKQVILDPS